MADYRLGIALCLEANLSRRCLYRGPVDKYRHERPTRWDAPPIELYIQEQLLRALCKNLKDLQ